MTLRPGTWWLPCIGIAALTFLAGCSKTVDPQQFLAEGKQLREAGNNRSAPSNSGTRCKRTPSRRGALFAGHDLQRDRES
jgi:hypothetical protein